MAIQSEQTIADRNARTENLKRITAELQVKLLISTRIDKQLTSNRLKIVSESKWAELIKWVREKLKTEHIAKQQEPNDSMLATYFKSPRFITKVENSVDVLVGLDKDEKHQHLIAEKAANEKQIENMQLLLLHIKKPQLNNDIGIVEIPLVVTGKAIIENLEHLKIAEFNNKSSIKTQLAIREKELFASEYILADHKQLNQQAIEALHPELVQIKQKRQQITNAIANADKDIEQSKKYGISKGWSKDGTVSALRPEWTKTAARQEWESTLRSAVKTHTDRTNLFNSTENTYKNIVSAINNNGSTIEQWKKDNFKVQYELDPVYQNLQLTRDNHSLTLSTINTITKTLEHHKTKLFEMENFNPRDIINNNNFIALIKSEQQSQHESVITPPPMKYRPNFPELSPYDKHALTAFVTTVVQQYPTANPVNLEKLCTIANDMTMHTIQNERGTLSDEKYNALTDDQEKQVAAITNKIPGNIYPLYSYTSTQPAISLNISTGIGTNRITYPVPEIQKNKLALPKEPTKAPEQTNTKKR